jgi:hypothetical protein
MLPAVQPEVVSRRELPNNTDRPTRRVARCPARISTTASSARSGGRFQIDPHPLGSATEVQI